MVSCKQCITLNSIDSAFCKKCGATLDANDIAAANEKLTAMVADGNRLFADGRTDDALMVAETAVASNPSSAPAISLKGMCLERKGMIAEALECFELVVTLQPDSTLDKLKVNDLKNMLVVEKFEVNKRPDRRVAWVGAVAATVLVISCGAIFAKANANAKEDGKLVAMNEPTTEKRTFDDIMPKDNQATQQQPQTNTQTQEQPNPGAVDPGQTNVPDPRTNQGNGRAPIDIPKYNERSLPDPRERNVDEGNVPWKPNLPDEQVLRPDRNGNQNPSTGNQGNGVDPLPGDDPKGNDPGKKQEDTQPKQAPGIIQIEVSKGSPNKANGGSEPAMNGNGRQALVATARSQMQSGNYGAAASTYERALRAGADQASTNQRLGQCYANLGRHGDAVAAYTRAADAFEKSGNASGAESCRQAIKVLGG